MIDEDTELTTESQALASAINNKVQGSRTTVDQWWLHSVRPGELVLFATDRRTKVNIKVAVEDLDFQVMLVRNGTTTYALGEPSKSYYPA